MNLFLKNVVHNAIESGGTIPPIITAAIISYWPLARLAVPNTYAALLIGPPISIAIIAPSITPSTILLLSPIEFKKLVNPVFIAATGGLITNIIIAPIKSIPNKGYNKTGFNPSKLSGNLLNIFFKNTTKYPAIKPARSAPKNPEPPLFASIPPTKPTARAGLSPMLIAMYPARTGNINPNAVSPTLFKNAANGVLLPKFEGFILASSNKNANAINIPPPITNGNICDTPFIKCLYILCPTPSSSTFSSMLLAFSSAW